MKVLEHGQSSEEFTPYDLGHVFQVEESPPGQNQEVGELDDCVHLPGELGHVGGRGPGAFLFRYRGFDSLKFARLAARKSTLPNPVFEIVLIPVSSKLSWLIL